MARITNNGYRIYVTSDDATTVASFHRFYEKNTTTPNSYGVSIWEGTVAETLPSGRQTIVKLLFTTKEAVLNYLGKHAKFAGSKNFEELINTKTKYTKK